MRTRARGAGFSAVEFFWPHGVDRQALVAEVDAQGLSVELFNMYEGNYANGERGLAGDPGRREEWRAALEDALDLASLVRCPRINALTGDARDPGSRAAQLDCVVENLAWAAPQFMGSYSPYNLLARVWEWHVIGGAEEGEAE